MCIVCTWLMFDLAWLLESMSTTHRFWHMQRTSISWGDLQSILYAMVIYIYIYIYMHIHRHKHTHSFVLFCNYYIIVFCGNNPFNHISWWRHQMETFSPLLTICERNRPVTGGFPSQRPVTQSFDVFFDQRLNKRLSKQSRRSWFETPLRSSWRHL